MIRCYDKWFIFNCILDILDIIWWHSRSYLIFFFSKRSPWWDIVQGLSGYACAQLSPGACQQHLSLSLKKKWSINLHFLVADGSVQIQRPPQSLSHLPVESKAANSCLIASEWRCQLSFPLSPADIRVRGSRGQSHPALFLQALGRNLGSPLSPADTWCRG